MDSPLPADAPAPAAPPAEASAPPDDGIPVVRRATQSAPRRIVRPTVIAPPPAAAELPRARRAVPSPREESDDRPSRPRRRMRRARRVTSVLPLMLTLGTFAAMMAVSFGQGLYGLFTESDTLTLSEHQIKARLVNAMTVFEGLDTVIVLTGLLIAGRPLARAAAGNRPLTWALAVPGFLILLGINLGYHQFLKWLVSPYQDPDQTVVIDIGLRDGWWAILLVCAQPAVVEELFFRYLLLGHLRPHLGLHGSVWVTAVIFGMAHLGNIPGWPVLILLGAGLGYARTYSGTLVLPIALHFLHNFAVLLIDYAVMH